MRSVIVAVLGLSVLLAAGAGCTRSNAPGASSGRDANEVNGFCRVDGESVSCTDLTVQTAEDQSASDRAELERKIVEAGAAISRTYPQSPALFVVAIPNVSIKGLREWKDWLSQLPGVMDVRFITNVEAI